jgi:alpha-D-ribose 1-methylphosphonate 5-triphosphate synthase subunit PhnH
VAALALSLVDGLTPVWLSPAFVEAEGYLAFHSSAPVVREPEKAAFVLAATQGELPPLSHLNQGDPRYPDRSATVILAWEPERAAEGLSLMAEGPGLRERVPFEGHGLGQGLVREWADNRASYPLGVDIFLAGESTLVGLPRSLKLNLRPG